MKVGHHLAHAFDSTRHRAHHVELIAVIDSHIWVGRPYQHGINATVTAVQIIEILVDRVFAGQRIIEILVVHHHLRLDETGLRPLQSGHLIAALIVTNANAALFAPVRDIRQPVPMRQSSAGRSPQPRPTSPSLKQAGAGICCPITRYWVSWANIGTVHNTGYSQSSNNPCRMQCIPIEQDANRGRGRLRLKTSNCCRNARFSRADRCENKTTG
jgi:hypothetical protein